MTGVVVAVLALAGVLGALIGSFSNVVIYRLPAGRSIARPGSACPNCGRRLTPLELVPILSWLAQRGRCRGCGAPISPRYPAVEALVAAGFVALAWRWFPLDHPAAFLALATWWTLLCIAALIDLDTFQIPDVLTLPGTALMLAASLAWAGAPGLPTPGEALLGTAIGAGVLTLVNRLGALVLRRLRDTRERLWPIGFDQANVAALAGAVGGVWAGLIAAGASLLLNLATRRVLRLPEPLAWGAWLVALLVAPLTLGAVPAIAGSLAACGAAALAGAMTWWLHDLATGGGDADGAEAAAPVARAATGAGEAARAVAADAPGAEASDPDAYGAPGDASDVSVAGADPRDAAAASGEDEPVAMGFGDVKLAALLGAVLGWERLLVALFLAVVIGAVVGVAQRLAGGTRMVPFGPFLALGGVLGLFFGDALIASYLGALGIG